MSIVLSHRGNLAGPSAVNENRPTSVQDALALGFGIETDIRRTPEGEFYISHDPQTCVSGLLATDFCAAFRAHPKALIALNIKELGDEEALIEFLDAENVIDQVFLFDMELIEPVAGATARRFRDLHPTVKIAARVSERNEPIERALAIRDASVIWLDEFSQSWATEGDVRRLKDAGRQVYAVSPDLHRHSFEATRARWLDFIRWGVDGICTDYPAALDRLLKAVARETAA
jgi:glycerophosphoryl diester phosphodiesterase